MSFDSKRKKGFFLGREAVEMLNECVNVGIKLSETKGDVVDMCKAVEDLKNELNKKKDIPLYVQFLKQFEDPMVFILLCACIVSIFLKSQYQISSNLIPCSFA